MRRILTLFLCIIVLFLFARKGMRVYFSCSRKKRYQKKQTTLHGTPNTHYVRIGEPLPQVDGLSVAAGDGIVRT